MKATRRLLAAGAIVTALIGIPDSARAAPYHCGASRHSATSGGSYCAKGSGEHRSKLYCNPPWSGNELIVYGPWMPKGYWSDAACGYGNGPMDQVQYEVRD